MGMVCALRRASDEEVRHLLAHPEDITAFLGGADTGPTAPPAAPGLLDRLFGRKAEPPPAPRPPMTFSRSAGDEMDLDKAWHGIHFLLTGTAWEGEEPACYLLAGGEPVGDVEVGYGPARALTSAQVSAFGAVLAPLTGENLRGRFDPKAMLAADIYPAIWDRDPAEDDTFGYLASYFDDLKAFVGEAAAQNSGLIIYLT